MVSHPEKSADVPGLSQFISERATRGQFAVHHPEAAVLEGKVGRKARGEGVPQRLFRSDADAFERVIDMSEDGQRLVTLLESPIDPPNVFLRTLGEPLKAPAEGEAVVASTATQVTRTVDPPPEVRAWNGHGGDIA